MNVRTWGRPGDPNSRAATRKRRQRERQRRGACVVSVELKRDDLPALARILDALLRVTGDKSHVDSGQSETVEQR